MPLKAVVAAAVEAVEAVEAAAVLLALPFATTVRNAVNATWTAAVRCAFPYTRIARNLALEREVAAADGGSTCVLARGRGAMRRMLVENGRPVLFCGGKGWPRLAKFRKRRSKRPTGDGWRFSVDFPDGTSSTILIFHAGKGPWTKPEDLVYDPNQPVPELGASYPARPDSRGRWVP